MSKRFFVLPFLAVAAYGQQISVAVLPSDGTALNNDELEVLTDKMREAALKVLPANDFVLLKQDVVVKRLGGAENYIKECKESTCIVNLGKKAQVDYVAQASVGKLGNKIRFKVELYSVRTEGLVGMLSDEESENVKDLLVFVEKRVPAEVFGKILPFAEGIGGVQIKGTDYEFAGEKRYLANISSNPKGAGLSFNGVPFASCKETPCKVELREGNVRIIANLEQYEIADTTISIKQNNQNINIRLKANFGILDIKPAYLDGIGKDERWDLTINGKAAYSFENRLSPNKYKVELSHRCYEAISFDVGINRDKREVFDMASHVKLRKGGLVLSAERDGEPVSEPVFVNGTQVGETPFSGAVPLCAKIEIGEGRETVDVKLKYKENVEYVHKLPARKSAYATEPQYEGYKTPKDESFIRLGARWRGGCFWQDNNIAGSKLFDKSYASYEEMEKSVARTGNDIYSWYLNPGLTLDIWLGDMIALATELNYSFIYGYDIWYKPSGDEYFAHASISYQTIEVPVLLRLVFNGDYSFSNNRTGLYAESGFQFGFPVSSNATVSSGSKFPDTPFKYEYSDFRVKTDYGLVFGFGIRADNFSMGLRLTYPLTKLDKYGTIKAPIMLNILNVAYDFF